MYQLLEILEKNGRLKDEELAVMTGKDPNEIRAKIEAFEKDNIIVGYSALINWEKINTENVTALIEVKVTPQRGEGFDKIAERIYRFPEVNACYLMSGSFDLTVIIVGRTLKEVALFVAERLAPLDSVQSTATHFVLKKYKDQGTIFEDKPKDDREAIFI
jgi:DNA-binding Lrp family transcriptional regulator